MPEDKNILFLINKLKTAGAENVFVSQANYLSNQQISVHFGLLSEKKDYSNLKLLKIDNEVVFFGFKSLLAFGAYRRLRSYMRENNISVIYSTLDHANIVARLAGIIYPEAKVFIRESGMADRKSWLIKFTDIILNLFSEKFLLSQLQLKTVC